MITLYRTKLSPERNALVDDLDQYLNRCEKEGPIECQYVKHDLDIEIKLSLPQDILSNPVYNYVAIQNENDSLVYYYFIMDMKWTAKNTVRLVLSIDSVNTFRDRLEWSEKTNVLREHRDRFKYKGNLDLTRIVDEVDEGIVPTQLLSLDTTIKENNKNINWYLMYKTSEELSPTNISNPISCYAFASETVLINREAQEEVIMGASEFLENVYYYFIFDENGGNCKLSGYRSNNWSEFSLTSTTGRVFRIYRSGSNLSITQLNYNASGNYVNSLDYSIDYTKIRFDKMFKGRILAYKTTDIDEMKLGRTLPLYSNTGNAFGILALSDIDRTDSRIMKIIELPYAPFNITYDSPTQIWSLPSGWYLSNGMLQLDNLNREFLNNLSAIYVNEFSYLLPYEPGDSRLLEELHDIDRESKLYNSNFYTYKLTYDNFYAQVAFERISSIQSIIPTIMLEFKPTNTINSASIFK